MAGFLPLAFATPWLLGALLLLPAIWWLLRLTPPRPQEVDFPPTRLLLDIDKHEETHQRSPWWLTLLRLTLAALLILALAGPIWRPAKEVATGDGTMWMLMDNGWTSARDWTTQVETAERLLSLAEAAGQPVLLAATADGPGQPLTPTDATTALERLRALEPRAWAAKRSELTTALRKSAATVRPGAVVWLSDGTQSAEGTSFQTDLANIAAGSPVTVYSGTETPFALKAISNDADALTVSVLRHPDNDRNALTVRALDLRGLVLGQTDVIFDAGSHLTEARFEMPSELRNDIARVEVAGENAAGAVQLVDDSWRRRSVGLLSGQ
ncbi:MAG: BatA domain-containing protein, partial [Roseibium sp.]